MPAHPTPSNASAPEVSVRPFEPRDEASWLRCRVLAFLGSQYYDDVRPSRGPLPGPSVELVAISPAPTGDVVVGILDVEVDGDAATIDTVCVHPDHQGLGVATALLEAALTQLAARGVVTLDAWTREDPAALGWYARHGFVEQHRYPQVHVRDGDDLTGFATPAGLSEPVHAFVHGRPEDEATLRERFARVYTCRQLLRAVGR
ncbi:GNAT family N-acetyltransferase [Pseudokineococcus sp. 1T1Z-3]|uniref:GNAT family N-acetyltransferase n=1 Tax=Pseudokineococcus sp. 1T1Z-3 TaxID=3132745 RepID=UPI00309AD592